MHVLVKRGEAILRRLGLLKQEIRIEKSLCLYPGSKMAAYHEKNREIPPASLPQYSKSEEGTAVSQAATPQKQAVHPREGRIRQEACTSIYERKEQAAACPRPVLFFQREGTPPRRLLRQRRRPQSNRPQGTARETRKRENKRASRLYSQQPVMSIMHRRVYKAYFIFSSKRVWAACTISIISPRRIFSSSWR